MDVMEMACAERADLADLLRSLTPEQWEAPSLCAGWRVRDVVAHVLSYEGLGPRHLARHLLRGGLTVDRVNAAGVAAYRDATPEQLLERLDRYRTPSGLTAGFGGRIALLDGMVHQQDVRRPLGLPRSIPADRLRVALDFARTAPTIGQPWRTRGLQLVATDVDWSAGRGRQVRGPGEALVMAMAGRRVAVDDLTGEGRPTLAGRTSG